MLLHQPSEGVEIACAGVRSESAPFWRGRAGSANRGVDVSNTTLSDRGQLFAIRRIGRVEIFSRRGRLPRSADEEFKTPAMTLQPCSRFFGIFGSGSILHTDKLFGNAHWLRLAVLWIINS